MILQGVTGIYLLESIHKKKHLLMIFGRRNQAWGKEGSHFHIWIIYIYFFRSGRAQNNEFSHNSCCFDFFVLKNFMFSIQIK